MRVGLRVAKIYKQITGIQNIPAIKVTETFTRLTKDKKRYKFRKYQYYVKRYPVEFRPIISNILEDYQKEFFEGGGPVSTENTNIELENETPTTEELALVTNDQEEDSFEIEEFKIEEFED